MKPASIVVISLFLFTHCDYSATKRPTAKNSKVSQMLSSIDSLLHTGSIDKAKVQLDSIQPIVDELNSDSLLNSFLILKSVRLNMEDENDSALIMAHRALFFAGMSGNKKNIIVAKNQIAKVYKDLKKYDSALNYALQAYDEAKKTYISTLPKICLTLYRIHYETEELESARKYLFEGFNLSKDPTYKTLFANNISAYYGNNGQVDSAIFFFDNYVKSDTSISNPYLKAVWTENLGILLTRQNKLSEGLSYQLEALNRYKSVNRIDGHSLFNLGVTYSKLKDFKSAEKYLNQSIVKCKSEGNLEFVTKGWRRRAENLAAQKQFPEAYNALDSAFSSYEKEMDSSFTVMARELETRYLVRTKDDQIELLSLISRQQRTIIGVLVCAVILIIALAFLIWRRRQLVVKLREIEMQQRILTSQMEPHFVFNTLSNLQALIRSDQKEKAVKYLVKFARLLRLTLENTRKGWVFLEEEVEALENYLTLQQMRYEGAFEYSILVYEGYLDDYVLIPPLLIQPFVENSIEHGMRNLPYKGIISVIIEKQEAILKCIVEDNGSGLKNTEKKNSLSISITRDRLMELSKQTRQASGLFVINKTENNGKGVKVELSIPYRNK